MNLLSNLLELFSRDLTIKKRQILGTSIANFLVGVFVLLSMGFASVALAIWLSKTYDMIIALVIVSALYLAFAAITVIGNTLYQKRQDRKKAEADAVRNLYLTNLLTGRGKSSLLMLAGVALASFLANKE